MPIAKKAVSYWIHQDGPPINSYISTLFFRVMSYIAQRHKFAASIFNAKRELLVICLFRMVTNMQIEMVHSKYLKKPLLGLVLAKYFVTTLDWQWLAWYCFIPCFIIKGIFALYSNCIGSSYYVQTKFTLVILSETNHSFPTAYCLHLLWE